MKKWSVSELERRMRPGALSAKGFLGLKERLNDVIREDESTLKRLGVTYDQIADRIEELVKAGLDAEIRYGRKMTFCTPDEERDAVVGNFTVRTIGYHGFQECPWSSYDPSARPIRYEPCAGGSGETYSSLDFVVTNNQTGETLAGPGLIVHLIRDHHFFEGKQSPYRVDPEKAARVLELIEDRNQSD